MLKCKYVNLRHTPDDPSQMKIITKGNKFEIQGSVRRKYIPIYIQHDAPLHYLYLETAVHVSGGISTHHQEHTTVFTASDACHTVTATSRYRGSWISSSISFTIATGSSNGVTSTRCCRYSLVLLKMGKVISRNMLS